jgi:hypothetical protein
MLNTCKVSVTAGSWVRRCTRIIDFSGGAMVRAAIHQGSYRFYAVIAPNKSRRGEKTVDLRGTVIHETRAVRVAKFPWAI